MIKNLNKKRMFLNNVIKVSIMILVIVCLTSCGVLRKIPNDQHSSGGSSSAIKASKNVNVCILFFNDIHGYLQPFTISLFGHDAEVGGIARMATLIDDIRTHNAQQGITTFVFLAGDILQGTPMSTVFKGVPDIECFNEIGVSVMTVGNHEFDFGIENFMRLRKLANFPILSCNIKNDQTGELLCDPSVKLPINDEISLVVIGVTTKELLTTTRPSNVEGISVDDPVDAVLTAYRLNKERFPTIVLSHCKASTDESIAQSIPSLTAIVGGHDQILFNPKKQIGSVPIFQAFEKGRYLGRLDLEINVSTHNVTIADWRYYPITADLTDSETVTGIVNMYHSQLDDVFKEVIGYCGITLHGERDVIRYEETNLGNLVTDIMRDYTGADIALLNAGSLRASISQGPVTVENVFQAMPYANELV
ncbi:5'-nucleotidase C-terminal domain-containing protein, partial [bacterium]|nr:5'-nucleotidase C-terminal domain-containing protein [candidate division CSSED10-310 bacterium]